MSRNATLEDLFAMTDTGIRAEPYRPCTCGAILLPYADPCPVHVGFINSNGVFMRRCGDSDATGGAYYVGAPVVTVKP